MPEPASLSRQQRIGGIVGVLVLAFALAYRFFPALLLGDGAAPPPQARSASSAPHNGLMGFERGGEGAGPSVWRESEVGPPVALASSEVIMAYRRSANAPLDEELAAWLRAGDAAAAADALAGSEESAAGWYGKVLTADADNRAAQAGLAEVARKLASRAHAALAGGDEEQAADWLELLRGVPLADAEAARVARALEVHVEARPLLREAAALLQGNAVTATERAHALALYRQVLELDADNGVARQGLLRLQRFWLDRALAAVARNDYADADAALTEAADIMPDSRGLQDTRGRVEGMRSMQAGNLVVQAGSALDSGNLALAQTLFDQALEISADVPGVAAFRERFRNAQLYGGHRPGQVFADHYTDRAGQAPEVVVLPIGAFTMGAAEGEEPAPATELPRREVRIDRGIALGRTEVTVAQFREFVRASGYRTDAERLGGASVYDRRSGRMHELRNASWQRNYAGERARNGDPVVNVSWNDALAYVEWLAEHTGARYRLPSEAEFEYALRAGTTTRYWWGEGTPAAVVENLTGARDRSRTGRQWVHGFADYNDGHWGPAPAGSFQANPFGLMDLGGNVSEWVADCWHDSYLRAPQGAEAWVNPGCETRVVRGGSWGSSPEQSTSSFRIAAAATTRSGRVGFRVLRELQLASDAAPDVTAAQAAR